MNLQPILSSIMNSARYSQTFETPRNTNNERPFSQCVDGDLPEGGLHAFVFVPSVDLFILIIRRKSGNDRRKHVGW